MEQTDERLSSGVARRPLSIKNVDKPREEINTRVMVAQAKKLERYLSTSSLIIPWYIIKIIL